MNPHDQRLADTFAQVRENAIRSIVDGPGGSPDRAAVERWFDRSFRPNVRWGDSGELLVGWVPTRDFVKFPIDDPTCTR